MSVRLLHYGRKAPKGWRELPGGIHLGKGMWILQCEPIEPINTNKIIPLRPPKKARREK